MGVVPGQRAGTWVIQEGRTVLLSVLRQPYSDGQ